MKCNTEWAYTVYEVTVMKKLYHGNPSLVIHGQSSPNSQNFQKHSSIQRSDFLLTPVLHWRDPTEARRAVMNQASNLLGVVPSHKAEEKSITSNS